MSEIDWSKAPEGATGAMVAHFDGGTTRRGDVEFIPNDEPCRSIYKEGPDAWVYHPAPAAPAWAGDGLPPVGTVCQGRLRNQLGEEDWFECTVLVHHRNINHCAGVLSGDGMHLGWCSEFRPLRTPEQIAAEERLHKIRDACTDIARTLDDLRGKTKVERAALAVVEAMIDAGYRKVSP